MSVDMSVTLCGVTLKNPVIAASGTFGFGREFTPFFEVSRLGGICLKALTLKERKGNPPPRIAETVSGMLNSVGLQNPGVEAFKRDYWPEIQTFDTVKIANIAGSCEEEYIEVIEALNELELDMYELNISCPNVKQGGVQFGTDEKSAYAITKKAKAASKKPLIVKLSPNAGFGITGIAKAAEEAGADALSLINTIAGIAVNAKCRRPGLANITGGLSGPAIKPVALKMVYDVSKTVKIPVIGMGGIMTGEDAAEFLLCGAAAVMTGTANIADPAASVRIIHELEAFAIKDGIDKISALTGALKE